MDRKLLHICLCVVLIGITGCATSDKNGIDKKTKYDTDTVPAKFSLNSSSFIDDADILYRVRVHTDKKTGMPEKAELTFQVRPGSNQLFLKSRTLSIQANGNSFKWPGREWINIFDSPPLRGVITTVQLGYDDLDAIANATEVRGNLGGQNFDWSYKSREPMRQLIAKVKSDS